MPGNEKTKSGILKGLFICRTSELNPRIDKRLNFFFLQNFEENRIKETIQTNYLS